MNISSNKGSTYDHAMVQAICMTQIAEAVKGKRLSLNRGLRIWGERGWNAVEAELSQIHNRAVFEPLDPDQLSRDEKNNALESHLFLEQKKDDEIKGRIQYLSRFSPFEVHFFEKKNLYDLVKNLHF